MPRYKATALPTLRELFDEFIRKCQTTKRIAHSTITVHRYRMGKILPTLGDRRINEIKITEIDDWLDSLIIKGSAPSTRNRYRALFSVLFNFAVRRGYLPSNPVKSIEPIPEHEQTRPNGSWREPSARAVYLKEMKGFGEAYFVCAAILIYAGCRISEALALTWGDFNLKAGVAAASHIIEQCSGLIRKRTKSRRRGGSVPVILHPKLVQILSNWRYHSNFSKEGDFVVCREDGRHLRSHMYRWRHKEAIIKAGLPPITVHGLRHTFAKAAQRQGFTLVELSGLLGHKHMSSTAVYADDDVTPLVRKMRKTAA